MAIRVCWDGVEIPGISSVGALSRSTSVLELRDVSAAWLIQKSPELTRYDPVTLERELGPDLAFQAWAALVAPFPNGPTPEPPAFRKDITIEYIDGGGSSVARYELRSAWPVRYDIIAELDDVRERLTLVHEGFIRTGPTAP
jgi:phage tail-like protein